ncbi:hypothetical protein SELMODRAFT_407519 [Selaginella moellendorffii]|uniref:Uncharacterized protein n=1 Tax=Selaginella moellendorffii TaxID=88036 RepID=D8R5W2_SELML|nr:uncharacterized protein LOC9652762 isoform X1 [Selaginella moellendorffii]EFJ32555.1 hypothetical protein SELMODRAFT_407519 [Selaginella moellendorffii]|eukprot:XP_002966528.1 uncharacterized protein LOC9652762 isoform X1 [Selaginella moellendorffii]
MASLDWLWQGAAAARAGARDSPPREDFAIKVGLGFQSRAGAASAKNVCCLASLRRHGNSTSGVGLGLATSSRQVRLARLTAKFRFDDSGNGGKRNGGGTNVGGMVLNAAITGALAYLTVTGKLGWIFDAVISLWLFFILAPLVALVAYFWFVEREIITGNCPNCGNEFQVFEFAVKDELQLCPYCTQPFKVDNKVFVRDGPSFYNPSQRNETRTSYVDEDDSSGAIVDVEAEVLDD